MKPEARLNNNEPSPYLEENTTLHRYKINRLMSFKKNLLC
jgi:hypothetical protein